MRPIQVLLIVLLLFLGVYHFARLRSRLSDRLIVGLFIAAGVALTIDPDFTNNIAHIMGVGRGVDLLMYLALTGISFFLLVIFSSLREMNERITELARLIALKNAVAPPGHDQETSESDSDRAGRSD